MAAAPPRLPIRILTEVKQAGSKGRSIEYLAWKLASTDEEVESIVDVMVEEKIVTKTELPDEGTVVKDFDEDLGLTGVGKGTVIGPLKAGVVVEAPQKIETDKEKTL